MLERTSDRWVSIALSVLLHGSLVAALVYGFWTYHKSQPPTPTLAIEATVVDARSVNGAAVKTPPAPEPPAPAPTPAPPAPEPVEEPTGPPEPTAEELAQREQALKEQADKEQAQKEQAVKEQAQKEQADKEQAEALDKQRRLDEQKQQEVAQHEAEEKQRQAQQKQREAQEKADADRKAAEAKRVAEQKRAEAAQREADAKARAESEAELRNSLAAEEHANQLRSSGALASWTSQISARIHRAWLQPPSATSGLLCLLLVTQAPGGAVLSAKLESCNGDQAVRESLVAAAYRASPLPPPPDPSMFEREVEVTFRLD
jgi:colicin import membrane protein